MLGTDVNRDFHDFSTVAVADIYGITTGFFETVLSRHRKHLPSGAAARQPKYPFVFDPSRPGTLVCYVIRATQARLPVDLDP